MSVSCKLMQLDAETRRTRLSSRQQLSSSQYAQLSDLLRILLLSDAVDYFDATYLIFGFC